MPTVMGTHSSVHNAKLCRSRAVIGPNRARFGRIDQVHDDFAQDIVTRVQNSLKCQSRIGRGVQLGNKSTDAFVRLIA